MRPAGVNGPAGAGTLDRWWPDDLGRYDPWDFEPDGRLAGLPDTLPDEPPNPLPDGPPDGLPDASPDGPPDSLPDASPDGPSDGPPDGPPDASPDGPPDGPPDALPATRQAGGPDAAPDGPNDLRPAWPDGPVINGPANRPARQLMNGPANRPARQVDGGQSQAGRSEAGLRRQVAWLTDRVCRLELLCERLLNPVWSFQAIDDAGREAPLPGKVVWLSPKSRVRRMKDEG